MNEIDTHIADYKTILDHKCGISGYKNVIKIDNCEKTIGGRLSSDLKLAKGVLINISVHENLTTRAHEIALNIREIITRDCECICSINEDSDVGLYGINYEIIISGLNYN